MARESGTAAYRRLRAEDALVPAAEQALDPAILKELRNLPRTADALTAWAVRHHLEAPCLVTAARELWQDGLSGVAHRIPTLTTWDQRRADLARLPPTWGPYEPDESLPTAAESIILKQNELEAARVRFQADPPTTADPLATLEADIGRIHRFWDEEMPKRRRAEAARAHAYALRPPLFDPVRGSRQEADRRWNDFCRAWTKEARRHGESLLPRDSDLTNAVRRSIAFQLQGREYADIARAEQETLPGMTVDVIRMSVVRFCALVDWKLRPARRGRRHATRPTTVRRRRSSNS
jgi:hypothetical protein